MKQKTNVIIIFFMLIFLIVSFSHSIYADNETNDEWNKTYGGLDNEEGYHIQQTNDGGYIIVGDTSSYGEIVDVWMVKTNSQGNEEWNKTFGGENADVGMFIQQTDDGGYVITGHTGSYGVQNEFSTIIDVWLIKTDENGTEEWNKTYGGTGLDYSEAVRQTLDRGYIIVGYTDSFGASDNDLWLIKTDENGTEEWNKTYGGSGDDIASFMIQNNNEDYLILGHTGSFGAGQDDIWIINVDDNGVEQWNRTYGGADYDFGESISQTNDDGYIIVGSTLSYRDGPSDLWLIKINSNGEEEWNKTFGGRDMDCGNDVKQTSDGGYIITGETESFDSDSKDLWLIKTDPNGNKEWDNLFGGPNYDAGYSILQAQDGSYIITGFTDTTEKNYDICLIKTFGVKDISHEEISPEGEKTPGFELIFVIISAIIVYFISRKNR